jgi:hypothetical protein
MQLYLIANAWQEHSVVEPRNDGCKDVSECNEIKDVLVFIEWASHLDCSPVIMAMKSFTMVAIVGDEVA